MSSLERCLHFSGMVNLADTSTCRYIHVCHHLRVLQTLLLNLSVIAEVSTWDRADVPSFYRLLLTLQICPH